MTSKFILTFIIFTLDYIKYKFYDNSEKTMKIFVYFRIIHRIFFLFLEQEGLTVSFWTESYKLHQGPAHRPTDWSEQEIIGLELGCTKIRTLEEFNYILDVLSWRQLSMKCLLQHASLKAFFVLPDLKSLDGLPFFHLRAQVLYSSCYLDATTSSSGLPSCKLPFLALKMRSWYVQSTAPSLKALK